MGTVSLKKLRHAMEKSLEPKRYEHTLGVAYTAASLAMVHEADVEKALIAGMLHDCAKCMPFHKQITVCEKHNVSLSEVERAENSPLLHAKAGSTLARTEYGITDEDILNAISYHTTGRPSMSTLEKIIYIADYIEPGRKMLPNLSLVRKMAYQNLDDTMRQILNDTLEHLKEKGGSIDPMTKETYQFYIQEL